MVNSDVAARDKQFLLAPAEGRILDWIARRVPARVMPDHMTALGVLAAIGIAAAYLLSNGDTAWLWAASALLVVHWLGDSLDGTLARVRGIERPKYGYYLDHLVDAVATALIGHRDRRGDGDGARRARGAQPGPPGRARAGRDAARQPALA